MRRPCVFNIRMKQARVSASLRALHEALQRYTPSTSPSTGTVHAPSKSINTGFRPISNVASVNIDELAQHIAPMLKNYNWALANQLGQRVLFAVKGHEHAMSAPDGSSFVQFINGSNVGVNIRADEEKEDALDEDIDEFED